MSSGRRSKRVNGCDFTLETTTVLANGVTLTCLKTGGGNPAAIFVHGSLNDYRSWTKQVPFFSERFVTVSYSRRNHYPNPWRDYPSDYSLNTERDDLISLIENLKLQKPVHLVGASYGAFAALLVASGTPELVRSLVLEEPPILSLLYSAAEASRAPTDWVDENEKRFAKIVLEPLRRGDYENAAKGFIDSLEGDGAYYSLSDATKEMMLQNDRTLEKELPTRGRDPFSIDDAKKIRVPTLLVRGDSSARMYQEITKLLSDSLPHAQTVVVPNSSHAVHQQNPEIFNEAVLNFLSSNT
jgi:non-heme chloroperoxidase